MPSLEELQAQATTPSKLDKFERVLVVRLLFLV